MSTCPDKSLYSAYADGEVPSPWKERLEEHLATCEKCRAAERRYNALHDALRQIGDEAPSATDEFLASSFKKLSPRWQIAAERAVAERGAAIPQGGRKSSAIPWFAFAAMFLVAAVVPALLTSRPMGRRGAPPPVQAAQAPSDSTTLAGLQSAGNYTPRLEGGTVYITVGAGQGHEDYPLINQAKMFAQDKEALSPSPSGYMIIRLPEMVRFGPQPPERARGRAERGFAPGASEGRAAPGYIINASQR